MVDLPPLRCEIHVEPVYLMAMMVVMNNLCAAATSILYAFLFCVMAITVS